MVQSTDLFIAPLAHRQTDSLKVLYGFDREGIYPRTRMQIIPMTVFFVELFDIPSIF